MIDAFLAAPAFWLVLAALAVIAIWLAAVTSPYDPYQDRSRLDELDRPSCGAEYDASFGAHLTCRRPAGHDGLHRDPHAGNRYHSAAWGDVSDRREDGAA